MRKTAPPWWCQQSTPPGLCMFAVLFSCCGSTFATPATKTIQQPNSFGIPHHHVIEPERYGVHEDYAGRVYVHSSVRVGADGTKSELTYNVTTRKGLISLDQYADIVEGVSCGTDWLEVRTIDPLLAGTTEAARRQLQQLNAGLAAVGGVVTGSIRWGCQGDGDGGFPGPFQRRIAAGAGVRVGATATTLPVGSGKIATSDVTYFECFEHINVRFHSDEPKPLPLPSEAALSEAPAANGNSSRGGGGGGGNVFPDDHHYRRGRRGADSAAVGFSHRFTRNLLSHGALDVTCSDCYASARIGVDFEIEMSGLTLKKFKIGLSGSVKATVRLVATVAGAVTIFDFDKKIPFSDALSNALSVAVFGPVSMAIKPQFSLWAAVSAKANIQLSMEGGMTLSQSISQSLSYSDYGWDSASSSSGLQIGALPFTQDCLLAKASAVLTVSVKPRLSLVLFSGLTEFYAEVEPYLAAGIHAVSNPKEQCALEVSAKAGVGLNYGMDGMSGKVSIGGYSVTLPFSIPSISRSTELVSERTFWTKCISKAGAEKNCGGGGGGGRHARCSWKPGTEKFTGTCIGGSVALGGGAKGFCTCPGTSECTGSACSKVLSREKYLKVFQETCTDCKCTLPPDQVGTCPGGYGYTRDGEPFCKCPLECVGSKCFKTHAYDKRETYFGFSYGYSVDCNDCSCVNQAPPAPPPAPPRNPCDFVDCTSIQYNLFGEYTSESGCTVFPAKKCVKIDDYNAKCVSQPQRPAPGGTPCNDNNFKTSQDECDGSGGCSGVACATAERFLDTSSDVYCACVGWTNCVGGACFPVEEHPDYKAPKAGETTTTPADIADAVTSLYPTSCGSCDCVGFPGDPDAPKEECYNNCDEVQAEGSVTSMSFDDHLDCTRGCQTACKKGSVATCQSYCAIGGYAGCTGPWCKFACEWYADRFVLCPAGAFLANPSATECTTCPTGQFQPRKDNYDVRQCQRCNGVTEYQDREGQPDCKQVRPPCNTWWETEVPATYMSDRVCERKDPDEVQLIAYPKDSVEAYGAPRLLGPEKEVPHWVLAEKGLPPRVFTCKGEFTDSTRTAKIGVLTISGGFDDCMYGAQKLTKVAGLHYSTPIECWSGPSGRFIRAPEQCADVVKALKQAIPIPPASDGVVYDDILCASGSAALYLEGHIATCEHVADAINAAMEAWGQTTSTTTPFTGVVDESCKPQESREVPAVCFDTRSTSQCKFGSCLFCWGSSSMGDSSKPTTPWRMPELSRKGRFNELWFSGSRWSTVANNKRSYAPLNMREGHFCNGVSVLKFKISGFDVGELNAELFAGLSFIHPNPSKCPSGNQDPAEFCYLAAEVGMTLSYNLIRKIAPRTFSGMQLAILDLSNNRLTSLERETFAGIEWMWQRKPDSQGYGGWGAELHVKNNYISDIEAGTFTGTVLSKLDLTNNRIRTVPVDMFAGLTVTHHQYGLMLTKNPIVAIEKNAFSSGTLREVQLRGDSTSYESPDRHDQFIYKDGIYSQYEAYVHGDCSISIQHPYWTGSAWKRLLEIGTYGTAASSNSTWYCTCDDCPAFADPPWPTPTTTTTTTTTRTTITTLPPVDLGDLFTGGQDIICADGTYFECDASSNTNCTAQKGDFCSTPEHSTPLLITVEDLQYDSASTLPTTTATTTTTTTPTTTPEEVEGDGNGAGEEGGKELGVDGAGEEGGKELGVDGWGNGDAVVDDAKENMSVDASQVDTDGAEGRTARHKGGTGQIVGGVLAALTVLAFVVIAAVLWWMDSKKEGNGGNTTSSEGPTDVVVQPATSISGNIRDRGAVVQNPTYEESVLADSGKDVGEVDGYLEVVDDSSGGSAGGMPAKVPSEQFDGFGGDNDEGTDVLGGGGGSGGSRSSTSAVQGEGFGGFEDDAAATAAAAAAAAAAVSTDGSASGSGMIAKVKDILSRTQESSAHFVHQVVWYCTHRRDFGRLLKETSPNGELQAIEFDAPRNDYRQKKKDRSAGAAMTIDELYEVAELVDPLFKVEMKGIAANIGGGVTAKLPPGGLKGKDRAEQKARDDYDNIIAMLFDIVRITFDCDNGEEVVAIVAAVKANPHVVHTIKGKNRCKNPTANGFFDIMMQVLFQFEIGDGVTVEHVCEVQVHVRAATEYAKKNNSHGVYEFFRSYFAGSDETVRARMGDITAILGGDGQVEIPFLDTIDVASVEPKALFEEVAINVVGSDDVKRLKALRNLADDYLQEFDLATCAGEIELQLEIAARGPDHKVVGCLYCDLGNILYNISKYEEALSMMEKAQVILNKALGENHRVVGALENNMAGLYVMLARFDAAMELYQKSLTTKTKTLGSDHEEIGELYCNMGLCLSYQEKNEAALETYQKGVSIAVKAYGKENPRLAQLYNNMSVLLIKVKKFEECMNVLEKAKAIQLQTLGPNHGDVGQTCANIAGVLFDQGNPTESMVMYEKSLSIMVSAYGEEHAHVASAYFSMGRVAAANSETYARALELLSKAHAISIAVYGAEHPDTKMVVILEAQVNALVIAQGDGGSMDLAQTMPTHPNAGCDVCRIFPLVGKRFNKNGHDYDLCESDFAKLSEADKMEYAVIAAPGSSPVPYSSEDDCH